MYFKKETQHFGHKYYMYGLYENTHPLAVENSI